MTDIRETGRQNWRQLQQQNNQAYTEPSFDELMSSIQGMRRASTGQLHQMFRPTYSEPIGQKLASVGYGESTYDEEAVSDWDLANLNEVRAVNQPGILQLGNGILKMVGTGITTFLDGTVGLLYGIGTGVFNAVGANGTNEDGTSKTFIQGLWDNDFNRAMSNIQDGMEELLPNYYTQAEQNDPWYTHILSANFLGDKVLKNMGFTIGALGAMYVTGGTGVAGVVGKGIQTAAKFTLGNAGKLMGASRGTLAGINSFARGSGQLAHHLVQTAVGASGEASIEAINAVKEGSKDAYRNLETRRQELIDSLDPNSPDYYQNRAAINEAANQYKQEIDSKFRDAGNSVYAANLAILSISNFLEFTSLIKGGFQRSAKLADFERRLGDRVVGADEWTQGILRGESASIANTVGKSWGRALRKAGLNSLTEGSEEAAQNLVSNSRQLQAKARLNETAEDTLLGARINPEVTEELVDYTKAFSKALYDNFGSPESKGWEEFFLGALTGGVGFIGLSPHAVRNDQGEQMYDPITHKKITSWKPRSISDWLQGGIVAARRELNEEYEANQLIVDAVNQKLADPNFIKRTQHAVASKNYANEMDVALQENDIFKFKNSEIGKLVNDVFFFRDKGMIDEYKSIFQGLTNVDDKTLQQLYTATADPEGNTELAQEDMEEVRNDYQEKAKSNLEKIQMIQDYYDFVDQEYRDRSQLFKEELAYQYIRLDDTRRRIAELEKKKESPSKFKANLLGLRDYINPVEQDGTTPSRDAYINSIESNNGLTETEQKDLERLKRQEKVYQHRIDKAKKNPAFIDLQHQLAYGKAQYEYDSKDVQGIINKIKNATTIADIDRIIASADNSVKQEIINRTYQEGDDELKSKLQGQIAASTAYTESKKRLEKIYDKEQAKELNQAIQDLLYSVYMSNNLDLTEVKRTLQTIHKELNEDSVATIAQLMPDNYSIFESFTGEQNKREKGIFSDVLEGTIEDVGNGIQASEIWKGQQKAQAKARKQQEEAAQRQQRNEEKKRQKTQSYNEAVSNSTYVKKIEGLEAHRDAFESLDIEELDAAIQDALEQADNKGNEKSVKNVLKFVKAVVANGNPQQKIKDLQKQHGGKDGAVDNILDYLEKKYKGTKTSNRKASGSQFKDLMRQLKDADKKGDAATVNSIIAQISADPQQYYTQGAKDEDFEYIAKLEQKYKNKKKNILNPDEVEWFTPNEVSQEISEKDGVKTTKFTWWRENKEGKLSPTIGGGLSIDVDTIDESSLDIEDVEKPVLTELREKDGKFTGTIRYSLKGQKSRIEKDVKFKEDPTKKKVKSTEEKKGKKKDTVGGSPVALFYLLENGPGTIKSTGYLLHAISAAYEAITDEIEEIRDKYLNQLDDNPENFKTDTTGALKEIRDIISLTYGKQGLDILDTILENATGFYAKEGKKIEAQLEVLNATIKEEDEDLDVDVEEEIILSDGETQIAVNKFYKSKHLDPNNLSIEEQQKIISNIEKVLDLIKKNEAIPIELQPYADALLATKDDPVIVKGPENPSTAATADNELNGAFLGLYDVGNIAEGRPNKLQDMIATTPDDLKSINYFYGSVQHAEQVQWCIDNILKYLKAKNTPIRVVADASKPNVLYPAVKATEELKKKAKVRWVVNTNDGEYIIIGTLGFNGSSSAQQSLWQEAFDSVLEQIPEGTTQGFFVSTNDKYTFKVNNIGDGRPAKAHYKTSSTSSIVELVEGDSKRNPQELTLKNLKWQIIYTDGPKSVHVNNGDRVRGNAHLNAGKVYLLIPTPSGAYYRHPVNPITIDEVNKDSELYKQIDKLISTIISNKKTEDVIKLKDKLVLESDTEDRSYLDVYFNSNGIIVNYVPHGSEGPAESLILSQDEDVAIYQLKEIIYSRIRPFISITLAHLSSPATIKQLDKAGALQLKGSLGMLSYVGANYTVVPYSASTNSKPDSRRRSSLESEETELRYQGEQIFKKGNDYYRGDELITDAAEIETLNDISAINDGQYTEESLWKWELKGKGKNKEWIKKPFEGEYFFIEKGSQTVVYHKDARGNITKESSDEAKKILNTRAENQKYAIDKAREEAIKSGEAEAGEDIDLDIDENNEIDENEEPTALEERIIIDSSLGGAGMTQVFGYNPNTAKYKNDRTLQFWKNRKSDSRSIKNPATNNTRENFYLELPDGTSIVTYYKDKDGRTFGRLDGIGITIWRKLTPIEQRKVQDYLIENGISEGYDGMAKAIDAIMHDKDTNSSSQNDSSSIDKMVEVTVPGVQGSFKQKALDVELNELKDGDVIGWTAKGSMGVEIDDKGTFRGAKQDGDGKTFYAVEKWGKRIVLPLGRRYFKLSIPNTRPKSGEYVYYEVMTSEANSNRLTNIFRSIERSAEEREISIEEALSYIKSSVKNPTYSDAELKDALDYIINDKAPKNKRKKQRALRRAERELDIHIGDVIEDNKGRRFTVQDYVWSPIRMDDGNPYGVEGIDGTPVIVLQLATDSSTILREDIESVRRTYKKVDTTSEQRKQDAIKRATYDLEQKKGLKVGDTIMLPSETQPNYQAIITGIEFSELDTIEDDYSYSDIQGTVVLTYEDDGLTYTIPVSEVLSDAKYKKINKQLQKSLKDQDNLEKNTTFVARLLDSKQNTLALEDILYNKAASIAEKKGIDFNEDCSINELIEWFKENIKFDLNSIPSNADINTVQEIIENCK